MPSSLRMKIGMTTIAVLLITSITAASLSRWDDSPAEASSKRQLASSLKMQRLMGKHLAPVTVQIEAPDSIPEYDHQEVRVRGHITLNRDLDSALEYQWSLPNGVHLVSGQIKDSLTGMRPGQTAEVEISVTGFSKEALRHITLYGQLTLDSGNVGHSALISSRPEDSWEYVAPEMRARAQSDRPAEFNSGRLVK